MSGTAIIMDDGRVQSELYSHHHGGGRSGTANTMGERGVH